ncbi:MAG: electron transfer flavoprotein subunit alpha [Desulfomonile tiedjei]|nr:electron transfer flavoprotein subunit alpha [Desulfomonile tiedjei]
MAIRIDLEKCNGCTMCARACPYQALEMQDKKARWIEDRCTLCGACLESCKFEALSGQIPVREAPDFSDYRGVWVFVEQHDGAFHKSAYELLGCARTLADDLGQEVVGVIFGNDLREKARDLIHCGADRCIVVEDPSLVYYQTCTYTHVLGQLIVRHRPNILLVAATHLGRDLAPRVARRVGLGLTADCTRLSIDLEEKILLQTRPAFGGNIMATIVTRFSRPQMATVRPGIMKALEPDPSRTGAVEPEQVTLADCREFTKVLECVMRERAGVDLGSAKIIVAGGRPVCSDRGIAVLEEFAEAVGGQLACTRVVAEEGFMSQEHQVGQTGKSVRPEIYFACGISGAVQHKAGMDGSRYIIAINKDPDASIFAIADFAIVGDIFEVLPALTRAVREQRS